MKRSIVLGAFILVLAAGCGNSSQSTNTNDQSQNTPTPVVTTPVPTPPAPSQSYKSALATYGTNRIQYNEDCTATPNTVSTKGGTKFMIDNRSDMARTISVGTTTVHVAKWDWTAITLPTVTASKTIYGSCDTLKNDLTVILQPKK